MQWKGKVAALCAAWALACAAGAAQPALATGEAQEVAQWAIDSGDAQGHPFVVVDKKAARLFAFSADGQLVAAADVLLGAALGDHSVPGVGERAQTGTLAPEDRTTPAGLSRQHAYMLCSLAGDLRVTQTVNGSKGVHMMMAKSVVRSIGASAIRRVAAG